MSQQQQTQNQNVNQPGQPISRDPKTFSETYLDKKTGALIFAIIIILVGFILFLQVSSVQMTGDASGLAGSSMASSGSENEDGDDTTYNSYCAGFTEFIAMLLVVGGIYWLAYILTVKKDADKLVKGGHLLAACAIDAKKGVTASNELIQTQITINEEEALRRGMQIHHLDVETDDDEEDDEEEEQ